jgi:hypothetical protein
MDTYSEKPGTFILVDSYLKFPFIKNHCWQSNLLVLYSQQGERAIRKPSTVMHLRHGKSCLVNHGKYLKRRRIGTYIVNRSTTNIPYKDDLSKPNYFAPLMLRY